MLLAQQVREQRPVLAVLSHRQLREPALPLTARPGGGYWLAAAVPATLVALFLLIAATVTHSPAHVRTGRHPRDGQGRTG
ncbi:hypothetical protein ACFYW9_12230 [Streptomyces sp. NPDC002698]|uniref:hypothetical protein n=1 Tax=Streptomyces sp. NPDC002698 TaxID=3364660 RepID=UPI00367D050D